MLQKWNNTLLSRKALGELPKVERFVAGKKLREIFNEGKLYQESEGKMYSAHLEPSYTPAEIANDLSIFYSTVSKAIKKFVGKS